MKKEMKKEKKNPTNKDLMNEIQIVKEMIDIIVKNIDRTAKSEFKDSIWNKIETK